MLLLKLKFCLFGLVLASDQALELRKALFDPKRYDKAVIQDTWQKLTRNDYKNLGEFAKERCSGYKPKTFSKPTGSYRMQQSFSTGNPYKNDQFRQQHMWCWESKDTIKIQLDTDQGFFIGSNETDEDEFRLEYNGYGESFTYRDKLPDKLASGLWFDTNSMWAEMRFLSNSFGVNIGFKFNLMCSPAGDVAAGNGVEFLMISNDSQGDNSPINNYGFYYANLWKRQINCLNDFETVRYRVNEATVDEAYQYVRLHSTNTGSWNLSYDNKWHDTESSELTIDHLTWIQYAWQYVVLFDAYLAFKDVFNQTQALKDDEIFSLMYIDTIFDNHEIYHRCAHGKNIDLMKIWSKINDLWLMVDGIEDVEVDPVWSVEKESINNFVHCVSASVGSPKTFHRVFYIETKCDINQDISHDLNQLSGIQPVNNSLLKYAKKLSTIEDFEKFNKTFDLKEVEELASATTSVHNGYIIRREDGNSFHRELPKDLCVQHVTANLAKHLHQFPRTDFTEVLFHVKI